MSDKDPGIRRRHQPNLDGDVFDFSPLLETTLGDPARIAVTALRAAHYNQILRFLDKEGRGLGFYDADPDMNREDLALALRAESVVKKAREADLTDSDIRARAEAVLGSIADQATIAFSAIPPQTSK